jgi:hypothetical protein
MNRYKSCWVTWINKLGVILHVHASFSFDYHWNLYSVYCFKAGTFRSSLSPYQKEWYNIGISDYFHFLCNTMPVHRHHSVSFEEQCHFTVKHNTYGCISGLYQNILLICLVILLGQLKVVGCTFTCMWLAL